MAIPLLAVFADMPDPRRETENKLHALSDILVIATCAVIGGADSWESIAEYGRSKASFFARFLSLANGTPSPDTFARVFAKLDPAAFAAGFGKWMAAACESTGLVPVAVDGKSVRGSAKATATGCLHLVSAWASDNRLTLGQVSVPDGSHELSAIPELLAMLELTGAIVTLDAAGCQAAIARQIREKGGDYLLAVKGNQPGLHAAVTQAFADACAAEFDGVAYDQGATVEDGHGRHEERYVTVIHDPTGLPEGWTDATAVVQVNREREVDGRNVTTTHYYVSSHRGTAKEMGEFVRGHWGIENGLHWVLDVVFREDDSRVRSGHAGANLAMIRKVAVALLRNAPGKGSGVTKRLKAGWDDEYLLNVLHGIQDKVVR
jgi:predicted transposase YbfD/YdcC